MKAYSLCQYKEEKNGKVVSALAKISTRGVFGKTGHYLSLGWGGEIEGLFRSLTGTWKSIFYGPPTSYSVGSN